MKWRQDSVTGKLVPIDEATQRHAGHYVQGDIEPFVSPVDGSVISDRRQLAEHNKRNNVVNAAEFSQEYYDKKAQERSDFYNGKHSRQETLARKQEIYETWTRAERQQ